MIFSLFPVDSQFVVFYCERDSRWKICTASLINERVCEREMKKEKDDNRVDNEMDQRAS